MTDTSNSDVHATNKRRLADFLFRLSESDGTAIDATLAACPSASTWAVVRLCRCSSSSSDTSRVALGAL